MSRSREQHGFSFAKLTADLIRQAVREPRWRGAAEDETNAAEPLNQENEPPINQNGAILSLPESSSFSESLVALTDKTIWGLDGGVLTWKFPNGRLLVGRSVLIRMTFRGHSSVEKVSEFPLLPVVVSRPRSEEERLDVETIRDYLDFVFEIIPYDFPPFTPDTAYYSDPEEFFNQIPENYASMHANTKSDIEHAIDLARNAGEMISFLHALRLARPGDIIVRDGRIMGSFGFFTTLRKHGGEGVTINLIEEIKAATNRGVIVTGAVKHPVAGYCVNYLQQVSDQDILSYSESDAFLYGRILDPGKRSTMWRLIGKYQKYPEIQWFYDNIGFFFLKSRPNTNPIRVEFITYNNMYRNWADDLAEQMYVLCRGSGERYGIPHPIIIADNHAKIHRTDLHRYIQAIIEELESSESLEDRETANWLKTYFLDPYYQEGV